MFKSDFAKSLGISLRQLERLEHEVGFILPRTKLSPFVRAGFMEKLDEYERKKRDNCQLWLAVANQRVFASFVVVCQKIKFAIPTKGYNFEPIRKEQNIVAYERRKANFLWPKPRCTEGVLFSKPIFIHPLKKGGTNATTSFLKPVFQKKFPNSGQESSGISDLSVASSGVNSAQLSTNYFSTKINRNVG